MNELCQYRSASILVAFRDQDTHDKFNKIERRWTDCHYYDYYCCDLEALKPTKKYLLSHGYSKVRSLCAIDQSRIPEVIFALNHRVEVCNIVCDAVKKSLENQKPGDFK